MSHIKRCQGDNQEQWIKICSLHFVGLKARLGNNELEQGDDGYVWISRIGRLNFHRVAAE